MRYPGAHWRPIHINYNPGGCHPRYVILHIMQGTLAGTDSWFRNPAAQVSAHFGTGKDGTVYQWVDTADTAWHAASANQAAIGIENEGHSGERLTAAQVKACARIFAWAHAHHPVALAITNDVSSRGSGLAWHGMGGAAWGGHPECPGAPIVAQRPAILAAAQSGGTVSATGPASWDAADWRAFDAHANSLPYRDIGPVTLLWWLAHAIAGTTATGMDAAQAERVAAVHGALARTTTAAVPSTSAIAAAVVAAIGPGNIDPAALRAVVEDGVDAAFRKAFPPVSPA